jgi:hypothetical protein
MAIVDTHARECLRFAWPLRHYPAADVRRTALENIREAVRRLRVTKEGRHHG